MSINIKPMYTIESGMKYSNRFCFRVHGSSAQFTEPISKMSGEKVTYPVPTYEALRGIAKAIYWQPGIDIIMNYHV